MIKKLIAAVVCLVSVSTSVFSFAADTVPSVKPSTSIVQETSVTGNNVVDIVTAKNMLMKAFPRITISDFKNSDITGWYEVEAGDNIMYYYPEKEYIFFGEIYTKDGRSLTADAKAKLSEKKLSSIPLDRAIVIGSGENEVIEFTDPDCPYCRKASEWFKDKKNIKRYVFMTPIDQLHPTAKFKAQYIMSSSDKAKAYEEAMSGKLDGQNLDAKITDAGKKLADEHKQASINIGVNGTPMFFVNKKMISGANFQAIEAALKK